MSKHKNISLSLIEKLAIVGMITGIVFVLHWNIQGLTLQTTVEGFALAIIGLVLFLISGKVFDWASEKRLCG